MDEDLNVRIAALDTEERLRLVELLSEQGEKRHEIPVLVVAGEGWIKLSHAQERIWTEQFLQPQSSRYHLGAVVEIVGPVDVLGLERSFIRLLSRHRILRTRIIASDGVVRQRPRRGCDIRVDLVDLTTIRDTAERAAALQQLAVETVNARFDLSNGVVMRARLAKTSAESYSLIVAVHHIAVDARSLDLLINEIGEIYSSEISGSYSNRSPERPHPEAVDYLDYAMYDRAWHAGPDAAAELEHWVRRLETSKIQGIPVDLDSPESRGSRSNSITETISSSDGQRLVEAARKLGVTEFALALSAWAIMISRLTMCEEVTIGVPVSTRSRPELEDLVGCFLNIVVVDVNVSASKSVEQLVVETFRTIGDGISRSGVSFDKVVNKIRRIHKGPDLSLFQSLFSMRTYQLPDLVLGGSSYAVKPIWGSDSKAEMELDIRPARSGRMMTMLFSDALGGHEGVRNGLTVFSSILKSMIDDPEQKVEGISCGTSNDQRRAIVVNSVEQRPRGLGPSILDNIFRVVAEQPDAVAADVAGEVVTYAALDDRARSIASDLSALGIGPERVVGILVRRSVELPSAILAVMMAGGVCAILDPAADRGLLDTICEAVRPEILVVDASSINLAVELKTPFLVARIGVTSRGVQDFTYVAPDPNNLAFICYSPSDSGRPDAVGVEYSALASRIDALRTLVGPVTGKLLSAISAMGPEFLVEILGSLIDGRTVLVSSGIEDLVRNPDVLQRASIMSATPRQLRYLLTSGVYIDHELTMSVIEEPFTEDLAKEASNRWPHVRLVGLYTSAEAGPIGANSNTSGVRCGIRPASTLLHSEMYINGDALARGYVGSPSRTAERFVPDPVSLAPGVRCWRSGQLGACHSDGSVKWRGNLGSRVTVRDRSISLHDVEDRIRSLVPDVDVAMVLNRSTDVDIACYATPFVRTARINVPDAATIRRDVQRAITSTSVGLLMPHVEILGELPVDSLGAVDRGRLQAMLNRLSLRQSGREPRGSMEKMICSIFEEVLGVSEAKRSDDFFAAGGTSLNIVQVVEQIKVRVGVVVPIRAIFSWRTVSALAHGVEQLAALGADKLEEVTDSWEEIEADISEPVMTPRWL